MSGDRPNPPADLNVPGLLYRPRRDRWTLHWAPRSDLVKRGYQRKGARLWPSDATPHQQTEPTRAEWEVISAWCNRYHAEQMLWARGGVTDDPRSLFDGSVAGLIEIYQTHKRSPFRELRYQTQLRYTEYLRAIKAAVGKVRVAHITFEDLTDWQDQFADDGHGGRLHARAANLTGQLKRIMSFGSLVLPKSAGCHDVCDIFKKMAENRLMKTGSRQRGEYMSAAQCRLHRQTAHAMGHHSVALEQAFAFELGLRQKDVLGEWVPIAFPGTTDVHVATRKWLLGIRWEEIDANLILTHRLSKSLRGKSAIMDPKAGKQKAWDLTAYPMIMDELAHMCGGTVDRAKLPVSGPLVICETLGRPWTKDNFELVWRKIARAAGLPDTLQNRDSRPGAATEADLAGATREDIQRGLGHSKGETTEIYLRDEVEKNRKLAKLRVEKRK